ncbi:hypothetical protein ACOMHN_013609 [Nucella lapillus]
MAGRIELTLKPVTEEFFNNLENYVVTVPTRVTSEGDYVTHQLHAKHTVAKRSVPSSPHHPENPDYPENDVNTAEPDVVIDGDSDVIHYRIPLHDGEEVVVRLRENTRLLSPGAVVETKVQKFRNVSDSEFRTLKHRKGCHLTGSVVGDGNSRVALGACEGLV